MKRIRTMRVRFALWTAGLLLVGLSVFGGIVYLSMRQSLDSSLDDSLRLSTSQAIAAVDIDNGQINLTDSLPDSASFADLQKRGFTIRILSVEGETLQGTGAYQKLPVAPNISQGSGLGTPGFSTLTATNGDPVRIYSAPILDQGRILAIIQVMQSKATNNRTLERLLIILLLSIPALLILSGFSGYYLATWALSPIDQITRTAQRISSEDLAARLNLAPTDDEVGRLASTLDQMLGRLEGAFRRERQFTTDASHELRTPLTAIQAIINVVREKRRLPAEYEKALDDIGNQTERLRTVTENLLYIARGDARQQDSYEVIYLSDLLGVVAESLQPMAFNKGLDFTWNVSKDLYVEGDSDALIRLFVNLIDNAVKYTDHGFVDLQAAKNSGEEIQISLRDTGKGIPENHLPHIFERFYRVEASRTTQGSGLGLSIVQEIVEAHHGRIEVTSQVGSGTCFQMYFPAIHKGEPSEKN